MSARGDSWSRRKAAVAEEERARERAAGEARAEETRRALDEKPDAEALAELNLPDPDTLKRGDDFSAFMAQAVPARLRRRALRRLWLSDPVLANLDELVDYGEDFTDAATVVESLQTAYRVGKGMLERLQDGDEADEADAPPADGPDEDEGDARAEPAAAAAPEAPPAPDGAGAEDAAEAARPPRHMRFTFADADVREAETR